MPSQDVLRDEDFPRFAEWCHKIRLNCGPNANVAKHRAIALFIPALDRIFPAPPSSGQWTLIMRFLGKTRETAKELEVEFPEPKGKWRKQREQFDGFDRVAEVISKK